MQEQRAFARLVEQLVGGASASTANRPARPTACCGACRKRAHSSMPQPGSPMSSTGVRRFAMRSSRCFQLRDQRRAAQRASDETPAATARAPCLQRAPDRREQLLQRDRLFEEIEGADARRLDRGVDGAVARHHHHRHRQLARARPLLEQRDAVGVGHPDVEQHQVRPRAAAHRRAPRSRSRASRTW